MARTWYGITAGSRCRISGRRRDRQGDPGHVDDASVIAGGHRHRRGCHGRNTRIAVATGTAREDWNAPLSLMRELVPHLVHGATTSDALHLMLDPNTTSVSR